MSDRGLPKSYRHMHGFGSHTFSFISKNNKRTWVKFHFKIQQGIACLTNQEASTIIAQDRESSQRDLYNVLDEKDFPRWVLYIQTMSEEKAATLPYNPFDLTKVWLHKDAPLQEVGVLELNRNPENYFSEVEQSAFSPANIVPGIGFSSDKMLEGRLFSYGDAHRYRLGVNSHQIPVNAPRCPFSVYHRDSSMRVDGNSGGVSYEPNSHGVFQEQPKFQEPHLSLEGAAGHWNHREDSDYFFSQLVLFRLMDKAQKQRFFSNTAEDMAGVSQKVIDRQLDLFHQVDPKYRSGVASVLGLKK